MVVKKTGISPDLLIHPGETISDLLEERGITQAELATRTGVSAAYVSNIIAGKKDISTKFAMNLEYALGVPKTFWLNLQANYDAELLELNEQQTITEEERDVCEELQDIIQYLCQKRIIPQKKEKEESILALRKVLQISNIANVREVVPQNACIIETDRRTNPYVLGAWMLLCQTARNNSLVKKRFDVKQIDGLIIELKRIMIQNSEDIQNNLRTVMGKYGIDFSVSIKFRGAPVQAYISRESDEIYQMVLAIGGSFANVFWFSLFHELGHIANGDIAKTAKFIDDGSDLNKEKSADLFAKNMLLEPNSYMSFVKIKDFSIGAIEEYAHSQNVMPYIVIDRLQKERYIEHDYLIDYKLRYKWAE